MKVSGTLTAVACSPIMAFRVKAPSLSLWRRRTYSRRTRLFLYAILSTLLISGAFTAVFLVAGVRSYNIGAMIDEAAGNRDGVALIGHAYNIDVSQRQVQMSWLVLGCGSLALTTGSYQAKSCGRANVALDFYVDAATNVSGSYDPATNLWYKTETKSSVSSFYTQQSVEFQTEHLLEVTGWHGQDQQYAYPFDTYILGTVFQAFLSGTNTSVPVLFLRIIDATSSFQPVYTLDVDVRTLSLNGSEIVHARGLQYSFHRVALSQLFVVVLFVVNWLLTAVVVYIAVSAYDGLPMSEGVLILPVSVILTIPALRALWVDAPAFGLLLDSCGTFLQMVIVSLASLYLVVNVGLRRKEAAHQEQDAKAATAADARVELDVEKDAEAETGLPLLGHQHPH